jgi:hypothetical protein
MLLLLLRVLQQARKSIQQCHWTMTTKSKNKEKDELLIQPAKDKIKKQSKNNETTLPRLLMRNNHITHSE